MTRNMSTSQAREINNNKELTIFSFAKCQLEGILNNRVRCGNRPLDQHSF